MATFDIVYAGELVPGSNIESVKMRVAALFGVGVDQIERLFSGKKVVIKSNLDEAKAKKYQQALLGAGLVVTVDPTAAEEIAPQPEQSEVEGEAESEAESEVEKPSSGPSSDSHLDVLPVGSDMSDPTPDVHVDIALDHLSMAEVGADLNPDGSLSPEPTSVDISHLSIVPGE